MYTLLEVFYESSAETTYLVFGILRQIVKRRYVKLELAAFAELSKACAQTDKIRPRHANGKSHSRFGNIINPIFVEPEAVWFVVSIHKVNNVLALLWPTSR